MADHMQMFAFELDGLDSESGGDEVSGRGELVGGELGAGSSARGPQRG